MQPSRVNLRRSVGLALVTLMALAGASGFLLEAELVRFSRLRSVPIAATRAIAAEGSANGFLVVGRSLSLVGAGRVYELYTGAYDKRRMLLEAYTTSDELLERADDNDLVWLMSLSSQEKALHLPSHIDASDRTAGSTAAPRVRPVSHWNCSSPPCPLPVAVCS